MAMEITNSYNNYASQYAMASKATGNVRKKGVSESQESNQTENSAVSGSKSNGTADYMNTLKKLAPSVEFRTGNIYASDKSGKTLTINPKALQKMQTDPEFEKKMKELIGGVEKMEKIAESFNKATGWTTVFRHSYIDENGNYCHIAMTRNDRMLNLSDKLREERRQNAKKLIEKTKENSAKKKEALEEELEKKQAEKPLSKAEQMMAEKVAGSGDGRIYVDDAEFRSFMDAIKEADEDMGNINKSHETGGVIDMYL